MSTRSGPRIHPYRRSRRTVSGTSRSGARRRLRQSTAIQTNIMGSDVDPGGCIDLTTNDTLDGDIIDLTDSITMANNSSAFDTEPVVVISPTDVDNADAFRRENGDARRGGFFEDLDDNNVGVIEVASTPSSSTGARSRHRAGRSSTINVDDSDDDLPSVPFNINTNSAANDSMASPEPVKITCPVCMETDSQIRRNRKLFSTTCGHIFCSSCIVQAIDAQHMCPTCRKRLTKRQIHQIYL